MAIDLSDYEAGAPYRRRLCRRPRRAAGAALAAARRPYRPQAQARSIVCEGWDAAGKGGAIQRLTAECDPRAYQVWPIAAPTEEEKAHHFLWRFWQRLPGAGEIAIFDRSWYGRVLVERVEGFATEAEWRRAYDEINEFEAQLAYDGTTIVKLFFHVTQETQDERLKARLDHPWKRWKVDRRGFPQPRPPRRLSGRAQGHVRPDRHALGAVDGDRRQQQESGPDRGSDRGRRGAGGGAARPSRREADPEMEKLATSAARRGARRTEPAFADSRIAIDSHSPSRRRAARPGAGRRPRRRGSRGRSASRS